MPSGATKRNRVPSAKALAAAEDAGRPPPPLRSVEAEDREKEEEEKEAEEEEKEAEEEEEVQLPPPEPKLTRRGRREAEEALKRPRREHRRPRFADEVVATSKRGAKLEAKHPVYRKFKVLVVGGGFAGVSCARALTDQGYDVVVLEGRNRLGGRVHSVVTEEGATIELGAAVLMGVQGRNPLAIQCRKYGVKMRKLDNSCPLHDADGTLLPPGEHAHRRRRRPPSRLLQGQPRPALRAECERGCRAPAPLLPPCPPSSFPPSIVPHASLPPRPSCRHRSEDRAALQLTSRERNRSTPVPLALATSPPRPRSAHTAQQPCTHYHPTTITPLPPARSRLEWGLGSGESHSPSIFHPPLSHPPLFHPPLSHPTHLTYPIPPIARPPIALPPIALPPKALSSTAILPTVLPSASLPGAREHRGGRS